MTGLDRSYILRLNEIHNYLHLQEADNLSTVDEMVGLNVSLLSTAESPNNGHFGTSHFVHYREAVLFSRSKNVWEM